MLQRFGDHSARVLAGGGDIFSSILVCAVESSLGVKGEVCDEPSLQEVAECIAGLRNATTLRAECITTLLLKAGLEPTAWLHRVILVVWRNGRAPEAWKNALIVPLYKAKCSHQCTNNYQGIILWNIPSKVYALLLMHR
jgi:hypothetical protein